jgi:two-component system OmpR family response regulator
VPLTPREFALLRFFLRNPGRVLSREQILANVWPDPAEHVAGGLETYVSYLRRKLDRLGPPLIETVRRVGYALRERA